MTSPQKTAFAFPFADEGEVGSEHFGGVSISGEIFDKVPENKNIFLKIATLLRNKT